MLSIVSRGLSIYTESLYNIYSKMLRHGIILGRQRRVKPKSAYVSRKKGKGQVMSKVGEVARREEEEAANHFWESGKSPLGHKSLKL